MSNISPQSKNLNQGIWVRLEKRIVEKYAPAREQTWILSGPIFDSDLGKVNGVDIPSHFFMVLVDVGGWHSYKPKILAFKFSQDIAKNAPFSTNHLFSIDNIEGKTRRNFFPEFSANEENKYEKTAANKVWPID